MVTVIQPLLSEKEEEAMGDGKRIQQCETSHCTKALDTAC